MCIQSEPCWVSYLPANLFAPDPESIPGLASLGARISSPSPIHIDLMTVGGMAESCPPRVLSSGFHGECKHPLEDILEKGIVGRVHWRRG
ncbi:hypothetical protein Pmani_028314 [Petrolisthes manimaculis]|uniref:Uncharacterized protein n=1 Tax=Petrolisthes manimaculis TaxID=1843537 RepID=A0AAE1TVL2_9EUCA|nr:hypothetical protein Pmani_028314 [Petrolisthes manimaculis]